jgi:poly(3-hydroxyalkanoate) synthetase
MEYFEKDMEEYSNLIRSVLNEYSDIQLKTIQGGRDLLNSIQNYWTLQFIYNNDTVAPLMKSFYNLLSVEGQRTIQEPSSDAWSQYVDLWSFALVLFFRNLQGRIETMSHYHLQQLQEAAQAWTASPEQGDEGQDILDSLARESRMLHALLEDFPRAIREIEQEFGFHFEKGGYSLVAETERFLLYRVHPTYPGVETDEGAKPVLIVHPYVLGADILAFLPGEDKSYVHCFANMGVPTYVRILKDIADSEPVQRLTPEDDILDTKSFCERITAKHGKKVTLNGYCQAGLMTLVQILSGELDGLVDAHITCVSPIDGSRSERFNWFLNSLPTRFNDLRYGTKVLPNGNTVADGDIMSWVFKLRSIGDEDPFVSLYRDLSMLKKTNGRIPKTAAALNYWLRYQRHDLPLGITEMSFLSYNHPIAEDGTLPMRVFGRKLNMRGIEERGMPWLICYGENDTLVEKETALAPLDYIHAEVTPFPKGHVAIATSWSHPSSECALHTSFGEDGRRGPVRFHMDLDLGAA